MNNFTNKKIGIWGFGVVGKSALTYFDQQNPTHIEILNSTEIIVPTTQTPVLTTIQSEQTIQSFLESNDFILASPGIPLHDYQQFKHKFISELDLYQEYNPGWLTIAITGSLGKTSVTHLLTTILQQSNVRAIAAGNIGYPMLDLFSNQQHSDTKIDAIVLELSSFQLQQAKTFAPNLAIITNIYPNHLDHHKDMDEYIDAKCNILKYQIHNQFSLLPLELAEAISKKITLSPICSFFTMLPLTKDIIKFSRKHGIYHIKNKIMYLTYRSITNPVFDLSTLPPITFQANWLIIIAALDLYGVDLTHLTAITQNLDIPDHRVQKIGSWQGSNFYNDSKSTVWQATLQAVISMGDKPIKLFVGGLSKGADRTPLFQALANKNIEVYTFGKEANQLAKLCEQFNITHQAHPTLDAAWQACIQSLQSPHEVLFSPGGSSFDLFADYKARGQYFAQLVKNYCNDQSDQ